MSLALTYHDSYLRALITEEREARALADVDELGAFPATPVDWRAKLAVLRAYILTALESNAATDEVFTVKLTQ